MGGHSAKVGWLHRNRRIRNSIVARWRMFEKWIDRCNKTLKSQLSASFCFIYLPQIFKKLQGYKSGTFFLYDPVVNLLMHWALQMSKDIPQTLDINCLRITVGDECL